MRKKNLIKDGMEQKIYKFKNEYGASVIRNSISYGHELGLWEVAVIKFSQDDNWSLCYSTPITDDVIGYLNEQAVDNVLQQIEVL